MLRADQPGETVLFGAAAGLVRSQALLRLGFGRGAPLGLLCIGSRQPGRFHPGLGTELLTFLARVISITISQWLNPRGLPTGTRPRRRRARSRQSFPTLPEPVPLARFSAAEDLRAAIGLWMAWLGGERRASAHTRRRLWPRSRRSFSIS